MGQSIEQDLIGRHDHFNIVQHCIPEFLGCPSVNIVGTAKELDLNRRELLFEYMILLFAECHCRRHEPNKLKKFSSVPL